MKLESGTFKPYCDNLHGLLAFTFETFKRTNFQDRRDKTVKEDRQICWGVWEIFFCQALVHKRGRPSSDFNDLRQEASLKTRIETNASHFSNALYHIPV